MNFNTMEEPITKGSWVSVEAGVHPGTKGAMADLDVTEYTVFKEGTKHCRADGIISLTGRIYKTSLDDDDEHLAVQIKGSDADWICM